MKCNLRRLVLLVTVIIVAAMMSTTDFLAPDDDPVGDSTKSLPPPKKVADTPVVTAAVPELSPQFDRVVESDPLLKGWNEPYHAKRQAVRERSAAAGRKLYDLHTFYTLDCTFHSLWQVFTLEMSWHNVNQGGFISRVISGCDAYKHKQQMMTKSVLPKDVDEERFGAFFAPTFSVLPNGEYYAPYNRPNAIWYWLNHTDLTEDVFALLDPDMVYMNKLYYGDVRRGQPVSQWYVYMEGYPYDKFECPLCPPKSAYAKGLKRAYDVGPPWMFHVEDLRKVMPTWVGLVPMLKQKDPKAWIIEMVAYSVAMAFHGLPHKVIYYGMIDNTGQDFAWNETTDGLNDRIVAGDGGPPRDLALLHYCYTWEVGEFAPSSAMAGRVQHQRMKEREKTRKMPVLDYYHFSKYRVPTDWPGGKGNHGMNFVSCEAPLLQEFHTVNALPGIKEGRNRDWIRHYHLLRILLPMINAAVAEFKLRHLNCALENGTSPKDGSGANKDARYFNLDTTLRTTHMNYWVSRYVVTTFNDDLETVEFVNASSSRLALYALGGDHGVMRDLKHQIHMEGQERYLEAL